MAREYTTLEVAGREIELSSPSKVSFPAHDGRPAITELDLAEYNATVRIEPDWSFLELRLDTVPEQPGEPRRVQPSRAKT